MLYEVITFRLVMRYCSGVSSFFHSASDFTTLSAMTVPFLPTGYTRIISHSITIAGKEFPRSPLWNRITSYNVCYTKLLRADICSISMVSRMTITDFPMPCAMRSR